MNILKNIIARIFEMCSAIIDFVTGYNWSNKKFFI